jgi:hypothetical protein
VAAQAVEMVNSHEGAGAGTLARNTIRWLLRSLQPADQNHRAPPAPDGDQGQPAPDPAAIARERGMRLLELQAEAAAPREEPGRHSWVNRRVEQLEFLDTRAVRWRSSVDFVVPAEAPVVRRGAEDYRLVPVTMLPKRALVAFDLRDEDGRALCLPTAAVTGEMIAPALVWVATYAFSRDSLPPGLAENLSEIVTTNPEEHQQAYAPFALAAAAIEVEHRQKKLNEVCARPREKLRFPHVLAWFVSQHRQGRDWELAQQARADAGHQLWLAQQELAGLEQCPVCRQYGLDDPPGTHPRLVAPDECRRCAAYELMRKKVFRSQLEELAQDFVVCVSVPSPPGTQRIVKLASDQPISFWRHLSLLGRLGQSLGWLSWPVDVLIGGRGGNHHLEVAAPPGVDITRIIAEPAVGDEPGPPPIRARGLSPHVHIRVPAIPPIRHRATIFVRTSRSGWLTASWLVTVLIVVMMAFGTAYLPVLFPKQAAQGPAAGESGIAATLLLALLGVIAIWLVRPGEHPLASRLLVVARILILADFAVVLVGTGDLVLHHAARPPDDLWLWLAWLSGIIAVLVTATRAFPLVKPKKWE